MATDVALGATPDRVGATVMHREIVRAAAGTSAYVVVDPVAPPRLRSALAGEVAAAFERAVSGAVPSMRSLEQGIQAAANAVERIRAQLVESNLLLDARIGAVMAGDRAVHVALTSGMRLYRARGPMPERMFPRVPRPDGVAAGRPFYVTEPTQDGDLLILGTRTTFTVASIGNLANMLGRSADARATELCETLVAPCRTAQTGSAVVVMRARA